MSFKKGSWPLKESFRTSNRSLDLLIAENVTVQVVQSTIQSLRYKPDTKK